MSKKLQGLERALIIQRIETQPEVTRGKIKNFIRHKRPTDDGPPEIAKFKGKLDIELRAQIILPAPVKTFDPKRLVSHQRHVIKKRLMHFLEKPSLTAVAIKHKHYGEILPIVAHCKTGLYVYDGNHRINCRLLAGKTIKAKYIDLRKIDQIIKRLKKCKH